MYHASQIMSKINYQMILYHIIWYHQIIPMWGAGPVKNADVHCCCFVITIVWAPRAAPPSPSWPNTEGFLELTKNELALDVNIFNRKVLSWKNCRSKPLFWNTKGKFPKKYFRLQLFAQCVLDLVFKRSQIWLLYICLSGIRSLLQKITIYFK